MKTLYLVLSALLFFTVNTFSAPWDTGYIEWVQPNDVTFIARSWGDEFASWMETDFGYQIIIGPEDYFYYAILDEDGEFTYSENKVGIDEPLSESYQLERSPEWLAEIEAEKETFNQQVQNNFDRFINDERFNGATPAPFRFAVVLVDFTPSINGNYDKEDFDTLFFSTDYYYTINVHTGPKSPDQEWVHGSLRDYYKDQSLGKLNVIGEIGNDRSIINPPDPNNPTKPKYVIMPESREYYDNNFSVDEVMLLVKEKAE